MQTFNLGLAYIGLGVADVSAWTAFAESLAGLEPVADATGEPRLRMDEKAWRIAVEASPADDILYAGFATDDAKALQVLAARLSDEAFPVREMTADEKASRRVAGGLVTSDPDGLRIELVHGLADSPEPFASPTGAQFVTGDMGLGHIVLSCGRMDEAMRFYGILGFNVSDYIELTLGPQSVEVAFLHCNPRHHSLALLPVPAPKRLNHLMVEASSIDTVLAAYNRALKSSLPVARNLGRHTNDHMLSFYVTTPAGFDLEYGCGGRTITSPWEIQTYNAISFWGHE